MVSTSSEKINMENSFLTLSNVTNSSILEKASALKGKLLSCYSDCSSML